MPDTEVSLLSHELSHKLKVLLSDKQVVLTGSKNNEGTIVCTVAPPLEVFDQPLDRMKVSPALIYDRIDIVTFSYSFSSHFKKFQQETPQGMVCNDKPNTPRPEFTWNVISKFLDSDSSILEIGCGISFVAAYVLENNPDVKYIGIDPQKEVHAMNTKLYRSKNLEFVNAAITRDYVKELSAMNHRVDFVLHCHPWPQIPGLWDIYTEFAMSVRPKYFMIQTYGDGVELGGDQHVVYNRAIDIFEKHGYRRAFQTFNLDINSPFYNNTWTCFPYSLTIVVMERNE